MSLSPRVRAGLVMFLTFFGWGVYLVPMSSYVERVFGASAIGWAYGMGPLAAMVSPLLAGRLADRSFRPHHVLFVSLALAALFLALLPTAVTATTFNWLMFLHSLCLFAALPILNSVVMSQLADPGREFGRIRLFGTLGWIASGWIVAYVLGLSLSLDPSESRPGLSTLTILIDPAVASHPAIFYAGAVALGVVACLSLSLGGSDRSAASVAASAAGGIATLLRDRQFVIFLIFSFLISIPLALYYSFANLFLKSVQIGGTEAFMTWGQVSEVVFLAVLPFLASRFSAKHILVAGIACWSLRYWLFAEYPSSGAALLLAVLLHGACYDFFFVTGTLYADRKAPEGLRNTAQSVVTWVTLGLGMAVGQLLLAPWLAGLYITRAVEETSFLGRWINQVLSITQPEPALVFAREFWLYPALFSLGLMVAFALLFRDKTRLSDAKS